MRVSILIPTRCGAGRVRCLPSVMRQLREGDEVIVCVDGPTPPADHECRSQVRYVTGKQCGPGGARNRGLAAATGELVLFLNDDVHAGPGLIDTHVASHAEIEADGGPHAMVLGAAPWIIPENDRVIDRLLRETSFVFFYDKMNENDRWRDWGFRHAWTLNLSMLREAAGKFEPRLRYPMFDDLLWAYRREIRVLYRPEAEVTHDHQYTPHQLLRRETLLGHQAAVLQRIAPDCAHAVFGSSYAAPELHAGCTTQARGAFALFVEFSEKPSGSMSALELEDLFRTCHAWRRTARMIGYVESTQGGCVERAQEVSLHEISREVPHADLAGRVDGLARD